MNEYTTYDLWYESLSTDRGLWTVNLFPYKTVNILTLSSSSNQQIYPIVCNYYDDLF